MADGTIQPIPIPFSVKSYLIAWVRLASFGAVFGTTIFAIAVNTSRTYAFPTRCIAIVICVASVAALVGSLVLKPFRTANPRRADDLTAIALAHLDPEPSVPASGVSSAAALDDLLDFVESKGVDVDSIRREIADQKHGSVGPSHTRR